ncbi:hypothetical protein Tco_0898489 [Tanacetum coccineum]
MVFETRDSWDERSRFRPPSFGFGFLSSGSFLSSAPALLRVSDVLEDSRESQSEKLLAIDPSGASLLVSA